MPSTKRREARTEFLTDVLTTAVEGGIGYWSRIYDSKRDDDLGWTEITLVDFESIDWEQIPDFAPFAGYGALDDAYEAGNEEVKKHTYTITLDKVASAINKIVGGRPEDLHLADTYIDTIAGANRHNDAGWGAFDAITADAIVQVACFGEVVYG